MRKFYVVLLFFSILSCSAPNVRKKKALKRSHGEYTKSEYMKRKNRTVYMVRNVLRDNLSSFRNCYYRSQKKRAKSLINGKVSIFFTLAADGRPQRVGVGESNLPIDLKACIIQTVWKLPFDRPYTGRSMRVVQELEF